MRKTFYAVIGIALAVVVGGGLIFVLGQTLFLVIGQPELVVAVEDWVDTVIFPAISIVGVLCYLYSTLYLNKKKQATAEDKQDVSDD